MTDEEIFELFVREGTKRPDTYATRKDLIDLVGFVRMLKDYDTLDDLIGITTAAEMLGLSRQRVTQLIGEGKIVAVMVGSNWVMLGSEIIDLVDSRTEVVS